MTISGPKVYGKLGDALEFSLSDFSGLLNVKSTPQMLADNELTKAKDVYGSSDGSITVRRGMAPYGLPFAGSSGKPQGIRRFYQLVAHGLSVSTAFTVAARGGSLYNVETGVRIGAAGALGTGTQAWQAKRVFDPDNGSLAAPAAPSLAPTGAAGLAAGTYLVGVSYTNALGESILSPLSSITLASPASIIVTHPAAVGSGVNVATGYNVYVALAAVPQLQPQLSGATGIGANATIAAVSATGSYPPTVNSTGAGTDSLVICTGSGGPYMFDGTTIFVPPQWGVVANASFCQVVNGVLWFGGIPSQPNLIWGSLVGRPQQMPFYNTFALSSPVMGLSKIGQGAQAGMVAGLNEGLSIIYGTGPSNFYQQDVPMSMDGVVAGLSMYSIGYLDYFIGKTAIYGFDGWQTKPISNKVEPFLLNDPLYQEFAMNGPRNTAFTFFYNQRMHFCYDSGSVGYPNTILCYDIFLNGWTVLVPGKPFCDATLLDAPGDPTPPQCVVLDRALGQAYLWDVYNGKNTSGTGIDDAGVPINAVAATKFFKIGQPGTTKRIQRVYPEIFTQQFSGAVQIITDYGASALQGLTPIGGSSIANALVWDQGSWDAAIWGGGLLSFAAPRVDFPDVMFEAISFALVSNPSDPPFRWQAISGQWTQGVRD